MIIIKDFWASWCKPCTQLAKILDEINDEYENVVLEKYDIEDSSVAKLMDEYKIKSVPYVRIESNGELIEAFIGAKNKSFITEILDNIPTGKVCGVEGSGCDLCCMECEVPTIEPEYCEKCEAEAEESGIDYEANFTHVSGTWTCENCGGSV